MLTGAVATHPKKPWTAGPEEFPASFGMPHAIGCFFNEIPCKPLLFEGCETEQSHFGKPHSGCISVSASDGLSPERCFHCWEASIQDLEVKLPAVVVERLISCTCLVDWDAAWFSPLQN